MSQRTELEYKLAQMFIVGFQGIELSPSTQKFLEEYQPGGVIYFACNYDSPVQVYELSESVQNTRSKQNSLPLIVAVDHEGGRVQRFRKQFTHFPEPAVFGDIDSPKLAYEAAEVMARELRAVGVNLNFHPLCDIHTRPSNPVIGRRAFGSTDEMVSRISSAFVRGFVSNYLISCVKHFPGHGDTSVDSHIDLPRMDMSWDKLLERELKPFNKAIKSRVDMIMTAHILNTALDPVYPVTLSYSVITNLLRKELRYNRLIITDDMQMDAVAKNFGEKDMIALAINAGCDILLFRDEDRGRRAMEAAFDFLKEGRITKEQVEASYARIKEVKERVLAPHPVDGIENVSKVVGCEAHQKVLQAVLAKQNEMK